LPPSLLGSSRRFSARLDPEEEPRVADRLARCQRHGNGPVEVQEHRMLVASEALGADRALRRALFRQPPEARENEAAPLEELGDEREREHSAESKPARLGDAREDQM